MNSLKLGGILKRILKDFSMDTFDNRLKLQKIVYLLQAKGLNLGFQYELYLYGPYSERLTKVGFDLGTFNEIEKIYFSDSKDEEMFNEFLNEIGSFLEDNDKLEIASSLHLFRKTYNITNEEELVNKVKEKRNYFNDKEDLIREVLEVIKKWKIM